MSESPELQYKPLPADVPPVVGEVLAGLLHWMNQASKAGPSSEIFDVDINFGGDFTKGVLILDKPYSLAIKTQDLDDGTGLLEAMILDELAKASSPPLDVPVLLDYKPRIPGRLEQIWMTKVGGEKLATATVRQFSLVEKHALGGKIGSFVAWMADAISSERYWQLHAEAGAPVLPERTDSIRRFADSARTNPAMDPELATLMLQVEAELEERQQQESAKPLIVADDDLRAGNMTFVNNSSAKAVVDFGICRPVSPERAMRHTLPLGNEVAGAAIESYEAASGREISRDLLKFWAIAQAASVATAFSTRVAKPRGGCEDHNVQRRAEAFENLAYLLPDRNWSGLTYPTRDVCL